MSIFRDFDDISHAHYRVVYADPPWTFITRSSKGKGRSPEKHYRCMSIDEIKALPVRRITTKDAVLLLWTTDPHLEVALAVAKAWGFKYKTVGFTWTKENKVSPGWFTGMGYWTRANPEMCLLCTSGAPKRTHKDVRQLIVAKRREHSRKPDEMYKRIERLVAGPYLELFGRSEAVGWDVWTNEPVLHVVK